MKEITIKIETTNGAFDDGYLHQELGRILHKLADNIEDENLPSYLTDINGNKVGTVDYK